MQFGSPFSRYCKIAISSHCFIVIRYFQVLQIQSPPAMLMMRY